MIDKKIVLEAWKLMQTARAMAKIYDENRPITKYVHSTSKGHEAIQIAVGMHLKSQDFAYPYYRDESMLLSMGMTPYELMLQVFAKKDDPFGPNFDSTFVYGKNKVIEDQRTNHRLQ